MSYHQRRNLGHVSSYLETLAQVNRAVKDTEIIGLSASQMLFTDASMRITSTDDGKTLFTDANVYLSGAANSLYIQGSNAEGVPQRYEFDVIDGKFSVINVEDGDFGAPSSDPFFEYDGDTILAHADIYLSGGSSNLYFDGTDENGDPGIFYLAVIGGDLHLVSTGSIP